MGNLADNTNWKAADCDCKGECFICDWIATEAWERQTQGGMRISILPTRVSDDPWGMGRFRELLPLNLVSYEDRGNGKWY